MKKLQLTAILAALINVMPCVTWADDALPPELAALVSIPDPSTIPSFNAGVTYPTLTALAVDKQGKTVSANAKFSAGISSDSGKTFAKSGSLKQGNAVAISGTITVDPAHVGKAADIFAVGLYNANSNDSSCDTSKGTYYMMTKRSNVYCEWKANGVCPNQTRAALQTTGDYFSVWNGKLTDLTPLEKFTALPATLDLSGANSVYSDTPKYTGYVCVNFGYRLSDGTLVFNGDTVQFQVTQ